MKQLVNGFDFANRSLLREIDGKLLKLSAEPHYYLERQKRIERHIKHLSDIFGWWLSNPDLRERLYFETNTNTSGEIRGVARRGISRVREAWAYLRGAAEHSGRKTEQLLNDSLLIQLAQYIDPANESYRPHEIDAQIFYPEYTSPSGFQVPILMEDFRKALINHASSHPIDKATYSHLALVGIQPFTHANKRLARVVTNSILLDYNLPPALISPGEREVYSSLLKDALIGRVEGNGGKQAHFYDYIGGKVNSVLDEILNDLNPFRRKR